MGLKYYVIDAFGEACIGGHAVEGEIKI